VRFAPGAPAIQAQGPFRRKCAGAYPLSRTFFTVLSALVPQGRGVGGGGGGGGGGGWGGGGGGCGEGGGEGGSDTARSRPVRGEGVDGPLVLERARMR